MDPRQMMKSSGRVLQLENFVAMVAGTEMHDWNRLAFADAIVEATEPSVQDKWHSTLRMKRYQ